MAPYRVLLVDDDVLQLDLQRDILADASYFIDTATNGLEALALLERLEFDVIVLDQGLPGLDGHALCRKIRGQRQHELTPVIMVTGNHDAASVEQSLSIGATDFLWKPYSPTEYKARVDAALRMKRRTDRLERPETLFMALGQAAEARDACTGDHCERVSELAEAFGEHLGLERSDQVALAQGGYLHDIGKLAIPDRILLKPGPLDEEEKRTMQSHTTFGADLCGSLRSFSRTLPIIRHHHERWNGEGYPDGLAGEAIPLLARVFQIVDVYDALASRRPYKEAMSRGEALAGLHQEAIRGHLDPVLTGSFVKFLTKDAPPARDDREVASPAAQKATLLIVDDDRQFRNFLVDLLKDSNYNIQAVATGREALDVVERGPPDLVLTDILMEGMDGIDLVRRTRTVAPEIPIITMSAGGRLTASDYLSVSSHLGADATLQKPFGENTLISAIESLLRRSRDAWKSKTVGGSF